MRRGREAAEPMAFASTGGPRASARPTVRWYLFVDPHGGGPGALGTCLLDHRGTAVRQQDSGSRRRVAGRRPHDLDAVSVQSLRIAAALAHSRSPARTVDTAVIRV